MTGMSPLLLYGIVPLDTLTSSMETLWVGIASLKLLGVAAAASRYHGGVCAPVVGSLLEPGGPVVRGRPLLDGVLGEKSSVLSGLREEARK